MVVRMVVVVVVVTMMNKNIRNQLWLLEDIQQSKRVNNYLVIPRSILNYDSTCLERWCSCTTNFVNLQHIYVKMGIRLVKLTNYSHYVSLISYHLYWSGRDENCI